MKVQIYLAAVLLTGSLIFGGCKKKADPTPTPAPTPSPYGVVSTSAISAITETSAICGGNVTSEGTSAVTAVGVCWDTSPSPTTLRPHTNDGAGVGTYTSSITGLTDNTTYYLRAYVTNASGTAYGSEISFKTLPKWNQCASFPGSYIRAIAASSTNIIVGYDNGIKVSSDEGSTWIAANGNSLNGGISSFAMAGTNIFASGGQGVFLSTNNGSNWTQINGDLSNPIGMSLVSCSGVNIVTAKYNGLYLSSNNGTNWTDITGIFSGIRSIAINGSNIYVGTSNGISLSIDNGNSWTGINNGLTNLSINVIKIDGTNIIIGTNGGVFKSGDNGSNWTALTNGLTSIVNALIINGTKIYAVTGAGLLFSPDYGLIWKTINEGLTNLLSISCLGASSNFIYEGNSNGNIFKRPLQ